MLICIIKSSSITLILFKRLTDMSKYFFLTILLGASWTTLANQPHVHGKAHLDIIYAEDEIQMEFRSPMVNLLGFEYQPQTKIEVFKYKEALASFRNKDVVQFNGIQCEPKEIQINAPWKNVQTLSGAHQDEHSHHDDAHSHHNDEHAHHDDEHAHKLDEHSHQKHYGHHHENSEHSEIAVTSHYLCKPFDGEFGVDVRFIAVFPKLNEVQVNWISESQQGAQKITPQANKIIIHP